MVPCGITEYHARFSWTVWASQGTIVGTEEGNTHEKGVLG